MRRASAGLVLLLLTAAAHAQRPQAAAGDVGAQLDALCAKTPKGASVGVAVVDVASGRSWFERQADSPLKPASVLKLFTTAAALVRLGSEFAYETRMYVVGDEVIVIGGGDPSIGDERIERRHGRPRHHTVAEWSAAIVGVHRQPMARIVLDDGVFDRQWRHPSWPADQNVEWYQAPVGGLNLNDNCVDAVATVREGRVELSLVPPLPAEFWENSLSVGKETRVTVRRPGDGDVFAFSGTVARRAEIGSAAVREPTVFFGHALRQGVVDAGGSVRGEVVRRAVSAASVSGVSPVAVVRTPIADVVWRANNFSQNLFADCLLKSLAAYESGGRRSGIAGSFERGAQELLAALRSIGVDLDASRIVDGSGLSHENRVTARQVARLLEAMQRHRAGELYRSTLATPGEDGTLRRRYAKEPFAAGLRAKTGTIRGVSTLAGYLQRADGVTLAFAILVNGADGEPLMGEALRAMFSAPAPRP